MEKPLISMALLYRQLRYGYAFRRIPLTQGKYAIVDPEDYERINAHKWYASGHGCKFYAKRVAFVGEDKKRVYIKMHRQIMKVEDGKFVDHINHNGLDNRKANLRPATFAENNRNRRKVKINNFRSKYKGISWEKKQKQWCVRIMTNRTSKYIGCYKDEIEAAKAYDKAAKKYHREFASLNFPGLARKS